MTKKAAKERIRISFSITGDMIGILKELRKEYPGLSDNVIICNSLSLLYKNHNLDNIIHKTVEQETADILKQIAQEEFKKECEETEEEEEQRTDNTHEPEGVVETQDTTDNTFDILKQVAQEAAKEKEEKYKGVKTIHESINDYTFWDFLPEGKEELTKLAKINKKPVNQMIDGLNEYFVENIRFVKENNIPLAEFERSSREYMQTLNI